MSKQLIKNKKGFTIIEVLIVLAIAGVIMLVVFLAVPALQRNSRNTQRKADVAKVLGAINEYSANQNGTLPAVVCLAGNTFTAAGGTCAAPTGATTATLTGQFTSVAIAALPGAIPTSTTANVLQIYTAAGCNGNALQTASARAIAAWFQIEPAVDQCQGS